MKQCIVLLLGIITLLSVYKATGQHTPYNPISNRVFTPFMINPAIAGSKDFIALDLSATIQGDNFSQLLSGNSRIAKKGPRYFGAPVAKSFTRFGTGAALFNDASGPSRNIGLSVAASYHIPLNDKNLSFISGGIALKGIYNMMTQLLILLPRQGMHSSQTLMQAFTFTVKNSMQDYQPPISLAA